MPLPATADETPAQLLQRLQWTVVRRLDGLLQGDYRTVFRGSGTDVAELREYEPGDDARYIDWNLTARMQTPYVREFSEDREVTAWMLVDRSSSMAFGPEGHAKSDVVLELVTTLAYVLSRAGNRVGALLYDNVVERTVPPATGRKHVLRLTQELRQAPRQHSGATDLSGLIRTAVNTIKRRSLVFLISDFLTEPGWEQVLPMLRTRHDVVVIRLGDPREVEIPDIGLALFEDSETGEQVLVDTSDPVLRQRLLATTGTHDDQLTAAFARAGVDAYSVSTSDDLVPTLLRIAGQRKQRRRR